jgi:CheY-like chemotaxis protein
MEISTLGGVARLIGYRRQLGALNGHDACCTPILVGRMSMVSEETVSVLVVDDDPTVRDDLGELLATEGLRVVSASNGYEALTILRGGLHPGLIILDLMMPVMDGYEFRQEQLHDPAFAQIPVVAFSAVLNPEEPRMLLEPDAYLQKPIEIAALLALVRQHCLGAVGPKQA